MRRLVPTCPEALDQDLDYALPIQEESRLEMPTAAGSWDSVFSHQEDSTRPQSGNDEVGIIRRREVDDFLPVRFVGIERDEVSEFLSGDVCAHAVNDHGADQRGRALEDRYGEVGNTGVGVVVGRDFSAPDLAQVATLMREADHENQDLPATRIGEGNFGVVERFSFNGRDGLG